MHPVIRVPFRFKILATVLFLVTLVVGLITFTMARMFHADKTSYVSDLVSVAAIHAAKEANVVLGAYSDRLRDMGQILDDTELSSRKKSGMMKESFASLQGCLAVRVFEAGSEIGSLADSTGSTDSKFVREALALPLAKRLEHLRGADGVAVSRGLESSALSTLTLAVPIPRDPGRPPLIIVAILDAKSALDLGQAISAFDVFLLDESGNLLVHSDPSVETARGPASAMPRLEEGSQAIVRTYRLAGVEMIGGFADVGIGGIRAGAQIPKSAAFFASRQLLSSLILVALALLIGSSLVSLFWSAQLTRSLGKLTDATEVIGSGRFDITVAVRSHDEMGRLAESFNHMASELNMREIALREAQAQLVQSEKLAAFGQLGAGIAHEIKNPLAGIQGVVQLTTTTLEVGDPVREHLAIIEKETKRCRAIIDNLLRFARQEKVAREPAALAGIVGDTAALMRHQMSLHRVDLKIELPEALPLVLVSSNQIQQVLMNLLLNAEQAMEGRGHGTVVVSARPATDGFVELLVRDDGPGIPPEIQTRIFEPFFTTKPAGKGTGLGLSVTFGIVRDHGGSIRIESEMDKGTTFILGLPMAGKGEGAARMAAGSEEQSGPDRDGASSSSRSAA